MTSKAAKEYLEWLEKNCIPIRELSKKEGINEHNSNWHHAILTAMLKFQNILKKHGIEIDK